MVKQSFTLVSINFSEWIKGLFPVCLCVCAQRYSHNELEKQRRAKMHQLFEGLRREVGITEMKMSKVFTLNRVRVQSYPHTLTAARLLVVEWRPTGVCSVDGRRCR